MRVSRRIYTVECSATHNFVCVYFLVFRTWGAGWALRTLQDLEAGDFVMEYQGEIYNDQVYEKRMQEYNERDEINYYVMKFGRELYVDAAAEVRGNTC